MESKDNSLKNGLPGADAKKMTALANQILQLAHDDILMHLRFFDAALDRLPWRERGEIGCMATDGAVCYYDPRYLLLTYQEDSRRIARIYLHMLLHCVFSHSFQYGKMEAYIFMKIQNIHKVKSYIMQIILISFILF